MDRCFAHEGTGGDQFILLIHVTLTDALAHVLALQLVDGRGGVSGVRVSKSKEKRKQIFFCFLGGSL